MGASDASATPQPGNRPVVVARDVSVTFEVYAARRRSLRRLAAGDLRERERRTVEAVKHVNFSVHEGESVGLIGENGSGKSTLLRAIGGLVPVTGGEVLVDSIPVLLGVNAALQLDLSGRQNVELGGTALGLSRAEVRERFEEIVAFADVEEAIDHPLRTYSSGMRARLQFAIATAARPRLLMVDEALNVGDAAFKRRANNRMKELVASAGGLFLVSHSMAAIRANCQRALWVHRGDLIADGPAEDVAAAYTVYTERAS